MSFGYVVRSGRRHPFESCRTNLRDMEASVLRVGGSLRAAPGIRFRGTAAASARPAPVPAAFTAVPPPPTARRFATVGSLAAVPTFPAAPPPAPPLRAGAFAPPPPLPAALPLAASDFGAPPPLPPLPPRAVAFDALPAAPPRFGPLTAAPPPALLAPAAAPPALVAGLEFVLPPPVDEQELEPSIALIKLGVFKDLGSTARSISGLPAAEE
ncbi:hypothetical protein DFJ73DRAFT_793328 [Zopfochytrium polystomum]|nr:hypothetical protein DFJ73DRAFT_793328 [Zopfochytrium polystomum]